MTFAVARPAYMNLAGDPYFWGFLALILTYILIGWFFPARPSRNAGAAMARIVLTLGGAAALALFPFVVPGIRGEILLATIPGALVLLPVFWWVSGKVV